MAARGYAKYESHRVIEIYIDLPHSWYVQFIGGIECGGSKSGFSCGIGICPKTN